jgi:hypothetical protein
MVMPRGLFVVAEALRVPYINVSLEMLVRVSNRSACPRTGFILCFLRPLA